MGSAANCKLGQRWVQWLGERWLIIGRLWLGQPYANEQKEVGPTLAIIVGPTQLHMLAQRWPNHWMLSGHRVGWSWTQGGGMLMNIRPSWEKALAFLKVFKYGRRKGGTRYDHESGNIILDIICNALALVMQSFVEEDMALFFTPLPSKRKSDSPHEQIESQTASPMEQVWKVLAWRFPLPQVPCSPT